jgi:hypothetical protein
MLMTRESEISYAREIDTKIAAAFDAAWLMQSALDTERQSLEKYQRQLKIPYNSRPRDQERIQGYITQTEAKVAELEPKAAKLKADAEELNRVMYGGWPRFFLVQHIHNSMYCSSFRPTTRVGWLPDVSGLTEAEAVAEHGATLCTKCFPSAPVELTVARVDPKVCPSSGKAIARPSYVRSYSRSVFVDCPDCHKMVQRTSTGLIRDPR